MSNLIVNEIPDVSLNVVSDNEINITLVEQPNVVVEFDVAQGPSGPKGDTGDISPELQALADSAALNAAQAAASAASASQIVLGVASGYPAIKPSLNLDFANTKVLDPRITFTRASAATYYDGKTVAKAEENLLLYSQEFDNASWTKGASTVTANTEVAPDGTSTADTLTGNGLSNSHWVFQTFTAFSGDKVFSVYAKAGTNSFVQMMFGTDAAPWANFDLATGVVGSVGTGITASIIAVGNGWYRCVGVITSATVTSAVITLVTSATAARAESNTLATTVHLWGAQLEQRSSVTAYTPTTNQPITNYVPVLLSAPANVARFDHNPTTGESLGLLIEEQRTNLLTYSERFDNAAWTKTNATVTTNAVVAPDGTLTADSFVNVSGGAYAELRQVISFTSGTVYTHSVFVKSNSRRYVYLSLGTRFPSLTEAYFDLQDGVVKSTGSGATAARINAVGNGWYRCSITATANSTGNGEVYTYQTNTAGTGIFFTGDGYSGIYIWGAQLEAGAFPTSYIKTEASQVTRSADAATMTGTNFSSWYRQDEGTLFAVSRCGGLAASGGASASFQMQGISSTDVIGVAQYISAKVRTGIVSVNNVIQAITESAVAYPTGYLACAFGYKTNDFAASRDGAAPGTDTSGNLPIVIRAGIGCIASGGQQLNGHVKRVAYWPKRLTNSELQAITAQ